MSSRCHRRSALSLFSILLLAGSLGGCCSVAPRAEKFFDRTSPTETVRMFRYAVEAGQWDAAYLCLVPEFREQYSELEFSLAIRYGSQYERNVRDLIENAFQLPGDHAIPGVNPQLEEARAVTVVFFSDPEDPATDTWEQALYLRREENEWRIDLQKDPGMMQNFSSAF